MGRGIFVIAYGVLQATIFGNSCALSWLSWTLLGASCGFFGFSWDSWGLLMFSLGALKPLLGSGWALSCVIVRGNRPTDGQGNFRNRLLGTSSHDFWRFLCSLSWLSWTLLGASCGFFGFSWDFCGFLMFSLGALKLLLGSGWALSCVIVKREPANRWAGEFS
jgi:hypothetical protein